MVEHEAKNLRNMLENTGNMKSSSAKIWKTYGIFVQKKPWKYGEERKETHIFWDAPDSPAITSSQSCQGPRDSPILTMALDDKSLVMTNIAMVLRWPIEIDGLPNLKMGGFSMANC